MSPSSVARMMHPARQIRAMSAGLRSYWYSSDADAQQAEALGVGRDLAGVERVARGVDQPLAVAGVADRRSPQHLAGRHALRFERGDDPAPDRGVDRRDGRPHVEGGLAGPLPGAFLLRLVEDDVHQRPARVRVHPGQHLGGDLDEVRLQLALVPLGEDPRQFRGGQAESARQQVVRLGDQLHVAVLDPVVHHLHEVAGAARAHVLHAGLAVVGLGRDGAEDRRQCLPRLDLPARHDARPPERALLTARHAGADVVEPLGREGATAPLGVAEKGVAAVDEDVGRLEMAFEVRNRRVNRARRRAP